MHIASPTQIFIGGTWHDPATTDTIDDVNPATEQVIATVPAGNAADIDAAVGAARAAATDWAATDPKQRAAVLAAARDELKARRGRSRRTDCHRSLAPPIQLAQRLHVGLPLTVLDSFATLAARVRVHREESATRVVRGEPVGVVGAITPWNYPLHQVVAKVAAALAAGCPVVLKPAEDTPLIAYLLARVFQTAGLPDGVLNVVSGHRTGRRPGARRAPRHRHDLLQRFDRDRPADRRHRGRRAQACSAGARRQVGQRHPARRRSDPKAVRSASATRSFNGGQTCSAWTRMLVHASVYDEAGRDGGRGGGEIPTGDPFDAGTRIGPLVADRPAGTRVRDLHRYRRREGARLVTGGAQATEGRDVGY